MNSQVLTIAQGLLDREIERWVVVRPDDEGDARVRLLCVSGHDGHGSGDPVAVRVADLGATLVGLIDGTTSAVLLDGLLDRGREMVCFFDAAVSAALDMGVDVFVDVPHAATRQAAVALASGKVDGDPFSPRFSLASLTSWLGEKGYGVRDVAPHGDMPRRDATTIAAFLERVREGADPWGSAPRLVVRLAPGAALQDGPAAPDGPFLSVITRTQGRRLECLSELLTSLLAQTDLDFELLVMGHRLDAARAAAVKELIDEQPEILRSRIRFLQVERAGRSAPLNDGFSAGRGRYVVICDDDDIPMPHWVQTFHEMATEAPGRLLRAMCVLQDVEPVDVEGDRGVRATGNARTDHPSEFDLVRHLEGNYTPNTAIAFPRTVRTDLGLMFDEELGTAEDWEFMVRAATVLGVHSRAEITCIYRWWTAAESSRTVHTRDEWEANLDTILDRFNQLPIVLEAGSAKRIRDIQVERYHLGLAAAAANDQVEALAAEHAAREAYLREIGALLRSRSWRATAPVRALSILSGRGGRVRLSSYLGLPAEQLREVLNGLHGSRSWRLAQALSDVVRPGRR